MDTRDTPEQAELRRAARQLARELGPATVADLDDATRAKRLAAAVRDAGWLELRDDGGDGRAARRAVSKRRSSPTRSAASVADVAFAGPVLAADLAAPGRRAAPNDGAVRRVRGRICVGRRASTARSRSHRCTPSTAPTSRPAAPTCWCPRRTATGSPIVPVAGAGGRVAAPISRARCGAIAPGAAVDPVADQRRAAHRRRPRGVDRARPRAHERRPRRRACAACSTSPSRTRPSAGSTACRSARSRRCSTCSPRRTASWRARSASRCTRRGPSTTSRPPTRSPPGRVAKAYCARAARTVCETAVQVHGGIGNTWECIVHVYLRRALLSSQWFGDDGVQLRALQRDATGGRPMDFRDSPAEAEFRARLPGVARRATTPGCRRRRPTTSTGPARPSGTPRSTTPASSG